MNTSKVKATYGKRNGNKSRVLARDSDSVLSTPSRPSHQLSELASEPSSPSTPTRSHSSIGTTKSLSYERLSNSRTKRPATDIDTGKDATNYDDLFAFPDSPPTEIPKRPAKLNMRRRERAKQKEKDLVLKQAEELKKKKERSPQPIRRFDNPRSKKPSSPLPIVFDSTADPLSPPPCLSVENSPEPESEPAILRKIRLDHSLSNTTPPRISSPALKRRRLQSPSPIDQHEDQHEVEDTPGPKPNSAPSGSPCLDGTPFSHTPSRIAETTLNVKEVSQAEKDAWSFLEDVVPVVRKPKLVANLGPSKFDKSDSDSDNDIDTQPDGPQITDSIYESLTDRKPESDEANDQGGAITPSHRPRSTFSFRKTYGSVRSYLSTDLPGGGEGDASQASEFGLDFMEQLGYMEKEDSPVEEDEFGGNLKTVHELRMLGGNTRFQDEVQYILDGISDGLSSRRSSLLELAEKCLDREFVQDFKVSSMPGELFSLVQGETDPISTFLIGFIICSMLHGDKNIGLAASLIQSYSMVPLLMQMLPDNDDILLVVRRKKLGASKVFQQLFAEGLGKMSDRFLRSDSSSDGKNNQLIFSLSLIALSSFVSLQGLEDKVDNILLMSMTEKPNVEKFFEFGEYLEQSLLPISKLSLSDPSTDEEEIREHRSNLHLIHLVTAQVEFMIPPTGANSTVILVAEMRDPRKNFLLNLLQFVQVTTEYWDQRDSPQMIEWCNALNELSVSILKLFILITTNYGYHQVSSDKYSRRGKLFSKIYEPSLAQTLISLLIKLSDSPYPAPQKQKSNLELFSWGLLVNLCESEIICEALLQPQSLARLKLFTNNETQALSTTSSGHRFHCKGYQSLVVGLMITVKGGDGFSVLEKEQIRRGLSSFEANLSESWGHGLRNQVSRVLGTLEGAM